ncbi:hypothetical protein F442_10506 [Phytophthora nicotianae P10297]|uniref:RxLR effector protein n=1 Tax=Phytophthora nicotianae P10297 TaxID=1317064 RepID=W2Z8P5_PHYNI|nr:hypothetical protein F442_10506 [Phytophthora nicotianae P10297]
MRLSTILLAITVAALASAIGAATTNLSKTASIKLEFSSVAAHANINTQRRLRKHDSQLDRHTESEERAGISTWLSENISKLKTFFNNVDEMDDKAAQILKGKTPEEAEVIYTKHIDKILPLLQGMDRKGITPENLAKQPQFKELGNEEAKYLKQFFDVYWKTFNGKKNG